MVEKISGVFIWQFCDKRLTRNVFMEDHDV
jgi:hypothetical protein